jgi:hypothetical protein
MQVCGGLPSAHDFHVWFADGGSWALQVHMQNPLLV